MFPIEFFWRAAASNSQRTAVIGPDGSVSFGQLASSVRSMATALQAMDMSEGGRVGIGSSNSYEHLVALLATLASGKTWIPLNPRSGLPELRRIIEFTVPQILILDESMSSRLGEVPAKVIVLEEGGSRGFASLLKNHSGSAPKPVRRSLSEVQAIKFTGGTTGTPKGVMQSCRAWNTMIASQIIAFRFNESERFLVSAPLTHGSSTYVLPILGMGGCLVFPDETRAGALLDAIEQHAITTLFVPPVLIQTMVAENATRGRSTASLRNVIYGAAPMSVQRIQEAMTAFGPVLATTYGQTEAPQIISYLSAAELSDPQNMASVGKPSLLTAVAIDAGDATTTQAQVEGEILVRGDIVMNGYWQLPEKTSETIVDGWLHTGDIGLFDERGFLFLKGRKNDVIITGGFNVYPGDVESALMRHPAVLECAVVGIADDKWGEAVHAAVTLRPNFVVGSEELISFLKAEVGSVLAPKKIHFFEALPKTAVDKISAAEVRMEIERLRRIDTSAP